MILSKTERWKGDDKYLEVKIQESDKSDISFGVTDNFTSKLLKADSVVTEIKIVNDDCINLNITFTDSTFEKTLLFTAKSPTGSKLNVKDKRRLMLGAMCYMIRKEVPSSNHEKFDNSFKAVIESQINLGII